MRNGIIGARGGTVPNPERSEGGTVPVPERDAAFGRTHPEGVGGGLFIRVKPVFLRDGRDMDDQVEVVVHDREAPHLDPAEVGDGDDPLHQTLLHLARPEHHRAVADMRASPGQSGGFRVSLLDLTSIDLVVGQEVMIDSRGLK